MATFKIIERKIVKKVDRVRKQIVEGYVVTVVAKSLTFAEAKKIRATNKNYEIVKEGQKQDEPTPTS